MSQCFLQIIEGITHKLKKSDHFWWSETVQKLRKMWIFVNFEITFFISLRQLLITFCQNLAPESMISKWEYQVFEIRQKVPKSCVFCSNLANFSFTFSTKKLTIVCVFVFFCHYFVWFRFSNDVDTVQELIIGFWYLYSVGTTNTHEWSFVPFTAAWERTTNMYFWHEFLNRSLLESCSRSEFDEQC